MNVLKEKGCTLLTIVLVKGNFPEIAVREKLVQTLKGESRVMFRTSMAQQGGAMKVVLHATPCFEHP